MGQAPLTPPGDPREPARRFFERALESMREQRWQAAIDDLERAFRLYPHPATMLNLATAQAEAGHLTRAIEDYRRFLALADPDDLARHEAAARAAIARLEGRIAYVTLRIRALAEGDEVEIDGDAIARESLASPIPVDPGSHRASVRRGDTTVSTTSFRVAEGARIEVALEIALPAVELEVRSGPDLAPRSDHSLAIGLGVGGGILVAVGIAVLVGVLVYVEQSASAAPSGIPPESFAGTIVVPLE
jgi:tetratricopeptide (TPR) repeat protein